MRKILIIPFNVSETGSAATIIKWVSVVVIALYCTQRKFSTK